MGKITKTSWGERADRMQKDIECGAWNYLFFKIWINRLDAGRDFDADREAVLKEMIACFNNDRELLPELIEELR